MPPHSFMTDIARAEQLRNLKKVLVGNKKKKKRRVSDVGDSGIPTEKGNKVKVDVTFYDKPHKVKKMCQKLYAFEKLPWSK